MSKVVNLRQARKSRARDEARRKADENAAKHGRSKAERSRDAAQSRIEATRLDGHKRDS